MTLPLLYCLHSGNLYGTERMALATAQALSDEFDPIILAPPGPALEYAARLGFATHRFTGTAAFTRLLYRILAKSPQAAFLATGVTHSLACLGWNLLLRRRIAHLHIVHGGADERLSYGRKRWLAGGDVQFVAVSDFVKTRLTAHGVHEGQIQVIENFLPQSQVQQAPRRGQFENPGIRRVAVVSRLDPIKQVDLLLDALDLNPALGNLAIRVYGTGWDEQKLRLRAAEKNRNVEFAGFHPDVQSELAASDLLLHLCPVEPFGLAILEAMTAGIPVLAPSTGGAASLIDEGVSGFHFEAGNCGSLATKLLELSRMPPSMLETVVGGGRRALATRFSEQERAGDYRRLIRGYLQ